MDRHARVVIVGGGIVGVATLYHLADRGWTDALLLERHELTSGSTWHAAGLLPLFNVSYSVGQIHKDTLAFYPELARATGRDIGLRLVSNIRLASSEARMDEYRYYAGIAKTIGVRVDFLSPEEVKSVWPLCDTEGIIGAIRHPDDGYIQPADATQAMAARARAMGAKIEEGVGVREISQNREGLWVLETGKGRVQCEHLVLATGNYVQKTARMVGLSIPAVPVEHQYLVTEAHPLVVERRERGEPELGVLRDSDASYYFREEAGGFLLGPYERGAPCCYVDGPKDEARYELFDADLERIEPHIESAMKRVPAFAEVGVKQVYNGAICYTPDGSPLVGPAPGRRNLWLNEGHSFGVTAGPGAGRQLAQWIIEGEPGIDMMGVDPRRFGPYAQRGYLKAKNEEAYANVFTIHYPTEERPAARPLKTSPCYERLRALGGVMGQRYGWERANWFAPPGVEARDVYSFRRSNDFVAIGAECRHVTRKAGLLDLTPFAKFHARGPGVNAWCGSVFANRVPSAQGRVTLCHLLSARGGVRAEFTICRTGPQSLYLVSAGAQEEHDYDCLCKSLPSDRSVHLERITEQMGVLVLVGPSSRVILERLSDASFDTPSFPWLSARDVSIGHVHARAMRVNFVGELGWELHHPISMQNALFDLLMEAGQPEDLKPFGMRAMEAMRIEKSYRMIGAELSIEYSALESGLDRFLRNEGDPIGKAGLAAWRERGFSSAFVTLEVEDPQDADAHGSEPVYVDEKCVGRVTSGGYGFRVAKSLALAMIDPSLVEVGTEVEVEILGRRHRARVIPESPFDPQNLRLRS